MTGTTASRICFDGKRAVGLEIILPSKQKAEVTARRIVLCGGAIGSAKLLLLSGIGEPHQLQKLGIEVVEPLVGVGRNLQNHPDVALRYSCKLPITLHSLLRADRIALAWAKALFLRTGPASVSPGSAGAFLRSNPNLAAPDLECHLVWAKRVAGARIRFRPRSRNEDYDGFSIRIALLQPSSRGFVRLASPDIAAPPLISHNYLQSPVDCEALAKGIRLLRHVVSQPSFDLLRGEELEPGVGIQSASELDAWVRHNADTQGHPVGTCRMGHDSEAVVDEELAVRGIQGVWVADSAVMPIVPSANTYATTVMIAERAADLVAENP